MIIMKHMDDYLMHYGILGMKWGVRRTPEQLGHKTKKNHNDILKDDIKIDQDFFDKNPQAAMINPKRIEEYKKQNNKSSKKSIDGKKVALGVLSVAGAVGAGVGIAYLVKSGKLDKIKDFVEDAKRKKEIYKELKDSDYGKFIDAWSKVDQERKAPISYKEFQKLSKEPLILDKGIEFQRISHSLEKEARDFTYVSFDKDDILRYRAFLPALRKANGYPSKDIFKVSMKATEQIKAPSKRESIEILAKVYENHVGFDSSESLKRALRDFNKVQLGLSERGRPLSQFYFEEVRSRGYNAIVDYNDAERLSRSPLIILSKNSVSKPKSSALTGSEILDAARKVKIQDYDGSFMKKKGSETSNYLGDILKKSASKVIVGADRIQARASQMAQSGKSLAEIANKLGYSESYISELINR